ncbi:hypothetical protein DUI87_27218 [Hirundo rustica rustica]|uniref:Core shell protein Gag P30 domain-containing protein n=1 Tax=Hirundo rustica rustica TaxID=333673 RepID=A0A3M0J4Z3_HIRRU|nr:hypothetical protein DUI87_27218 [Hirundo rustica rustica]
MPTAPPEWGQKNEEGRKHMNEYHNLIIKGIKEAAPRGQNAKKAFEAQQEKEESPTEWLDRLRKNMKQYSGIDPETDVGKALLRINFVNNAWPDIRKKLEKIEDWHNKSLDDLLKEAQKVYVRRDEEKAKLKANLMAVTMQEKNFQKNQKHTGTTSRDKLVETGEKKRIKSQYKPSLSSIPGMSAFTVEVRDIIGEIVLSRDKIGAAYPMASTKFWSCRKDEPDFKENFDQVNSLKPKCHGYNAYLWLIEDPNTTQVLLMTEAAIRTKERGWIHASRIKGPVEEPKEWTITSEPDDTKLTLKRGLGGNELGRPK